MHELYRLYIDESGTHGVPRSGSVSQRYLCLLGTIMRQDHCDQFVRRHWEALRGLVTTDLDDPPGFHLSDILAKKEKFKLLYDQNLNSSFEQKYLSILREAELSLCCIIIDKKAQRKNYEQVLDSYRVALIMLLKRYVLFLQNCSGVGDVIAEGRNSIDNDLVRGAYENFYDNGHEHIKSQEAQSHLTTKEMKIKTKRDRITGLEISDMLALPMKFWTLEHYGLYEMTKGNLVHKSANIASTKLITDQNGDIEGTGIKIFPSMTEGFGAS